MRVPGQGEVQSQGLVAPLVANEASSQRWYEAGVIETLAPVLLKNPEHEKPQDRL